MELVLARSKNLIEANKLHQHHGGILLVDNDGGYIIASIDSDTSAFGRSWKHLESLSPSWSEAHPDNAEVQQRMDPVQLSLF